MLGDALGSGYSFVAAPAVPFRLMFSVTATLGEAAAASVFTVLWRDGSDCEALVSTSETVGQAAAGTGPASTTAVSHHHRSIGVRDVLLLPFRLRYKKVATSSAKPTYSLTY